MQNNNNNENLAKLKRPYLEAFLFWVVGGGVGWCGGGDE